MGVASESRHLAFIFTYVVPAAMPPYLPAFTVLAPCLRVAAHGWAWVAEWRGLGDHEGAMHLSVGSCRLTLG